jgi:hypothetical protein
VSRVIQFPALAAAADDARSVAFPVPLQHAVAGSRRRHRPLIAAAGEWALIRGVSLPADHIALWAAVAEASGYRSDIDGVTAPWRASHMRDFFETVAAWCTLAGCSPPADLAESLWHLYGFLATTGRLHPASDSLHELRAAVVVFAGFDRFRPVSPPPPEPTAA